MHPSLAKALADYRDGRLNEAQYEKLRGEILRDEIGLGAGTTFAAPALPVAENGVTVVSKAAVQKQNDQRIRDAIEAGRKSGKVRSYLQTVEVAPEHVRKSVQVIEGGEVFRRILTEEEIRAAKVAASQAAAALTVRPDREPDENGTHLEIIPGQEVINGVITPVAKAIAKVVNPEVEAIRSRWKAGEFGPLTRTDGKKCSVCLGSRKQQGKPCVECVGKGTAPPDSLVTARKMIDAVEANKATTVCKVPCKTCQMASVLPQITALAQEEEACKDAQGKLSVELRKQFADRKAAILANSPAKPDKIVGRLCPCGGTGWVIVDVASVIIRTDRGAQCADPMQEPEGGMSYTAHLTTGLKSTIHSDSGPKAVKSACANLRGGAGFQRVTLDQGCILVLHDYDTLCASCYGRKIVNGRTCTYCVEGRVTKRGARFFFDDTEDGKAEDLAHTAGLQAMSGYDPDATCGRKKCKAQGGAVCYACEDAKKGGYQRAGFIRCAECHGKGTLHGAPHDRCRGKGYFNTTEFYWIAGEPVECMACKTTPGKRGSLPCPKCEGSCQVNAFTVTDEIRRTDLLEEDRLPLRDRPLTITIGGDKVLVGAGKVPSRKSGSIMSVTGTARNAFDTAQKLYGSQKLVGVGKGAKWSHSPTQGIAPGQKVSDYRATFSGG